jgi:hypothetical protein
MSPGTIKTALDSGSVAKLLSRVPIPSMVLAEQRFNVEKLDDIAGTLLEELESTGVLSLIKPGMRIAITGGSRGIAAYGEILITLISRLKGMGASPFVFPAMGSHGGGTAAGQREILAALGITEKVLGCPICASMETIQIGVTIEGYPVFVDKLAWESDGIILVNRVKYHTGFAGIYESGLVKMAVIGLGKQHGAEICHFLGLEQMSRTIESIAHEVFARNKILFGIATVENANDEIQFLRVLSQDRIFSEEPVLLKQAKRNIPALPFPDTDVLIVDEIGKNISGGGMDPHIVGRFVTSAVTGGLVSQRLVVLDVTDESHGSAIGLGRADITTQRAFDKFDFEQTYLNGLTARVLEPSKIPLVLANDRLAIAAAIKTCIGVPEEQIRIVRIKNSLETRKMYITENLIPVALASGRVKITKPSTPMEFSTAGELTIF